MYQMIFSQLAAAERARLNGLSALDLGFIQYAGFRIGSPIQYGDFTGVPQTPSNYFIDVPAPTNAPAGANVVKLTFVSPMLPVKGAPKPPGLDLNFNQGSLQCIAPCRLTVPADQRIDYGLTGNDLKYKIDLNSNYFNYTSAYHRQADTTPLSPATASNLFSGLPGGTQIATRAFSIGPTNFGAMMIGSPAAQPTTNWWTKYHNVASAWDPAGGLDLMTDDCRGKLPAAYVPGEPWPATALGHDLPEATIRLAGKHRGRG